MKKTKRPDQMNELLSLMRENNIPFEYYCSEWSKEEGRNICEEMCGGYGKYKRNQLIYGRYGSSGNWKFDAILQFGSYGSNEGLLETYGELGSDEEGNPRVMTAKEAFEIIRKDWKSND